MKNTARVWGRWWPQWGSLREPVVMGQFCSLTVVLVMQIYTRDKTA